MKFRRWLAKQATEVKQSYMEIKDRKLQAAHRKAWLEQGDEAATGRILKTRCSQDRQRQEDTVCEKTWAQLVRLLGKVGARRHRDVCADKNMIRTWNGHWFLLLSFLFLFLGGCSGLCGGFVVVNEITNNSVYIKSGLMRLGTGSTRTTKKLASIPLT